MNGEPVHGTEVPSNTAEVHQVRVVVTLPSTPPATTPMEECNDLGADPFDNLPDSDSFTDLGVVEDKVTSDAQLASLLRPVPPTFSEVEFQRFPPGRSNRLFDIIFDGYFCLVYLCVCAFSTLTRRGVDSWMDY